MKSLKMKPVRVYHPWWDWECYKAGFYDTAVDGMNSDTAEGLYRDFLGDLEAFANGMDRVMAEWPKSCEHFLSNGSLNRVAWLGQAAMSISHGVPACFRSGYRLLTEAQQQAAYNLAQVYLTKWEAEHAKRQDSALYQKLA